MIIRQELRNLEVGLSALYSCRIIIEKRQFTNNTSLIWLEKIFCHKLIRVRHA